MAPRAVTLALAVALLVTPGAAGARTADDVAIAEFEQATALYDGRRYDDALDAYARAYALSDAPALLFNIGQCHAALGEHDAAIRAYQRYLDEAGARADRPLALARIDEARRLLAQADGDLDDGAGTFVEEWWFWAGVAGAAALVTATVATGTWVAQDQPVSLGAMRLAPP